MWNNKSQYFTYHCDLFTITTQETEVSKLGQVIYQTWYKAVVWAALMTLLQREWTEVTAFTSNWQFPDIILKHFVQQCYSISRVFNFYITEALVSQLKISFICSTLGYRNFASLRLTRDNGPFPSFLIFQPHRSNFGPSSLWHLQICTSLSSI